MSDDKTSDVQHSKLKEERSKSQDPLSAREKEILDLSIKGHTNETIAERLDLSLATINSIWLRIRMKRDGSSRSAATEKVIDERADSALREANVNITALDEIMDDKRAEVIDLRSALALLHLMISQMKTTVWATDSDLSIHVIANGKVPSMHAGIRWDVGKSVYDVFKSRDPAYPPIEAHLMALKGKETNGLRLTGEFDNILMRVSPLVDEGEDVMGCIAVLNIVGE